MLERRSLKWPITLGVTMIVLLIVLIVGWVLLTAFGAIRMGNAPLYWTLLSVGIVFLAVVLVGVVFYLTLSIKAINLNRRQSNFIDSVTHELKSPIASLKLCLQTLTRRQVDDQKREHFHGIMLDDVERLDHLINHLLEAGHLDKKAAEHEWVQVDALLKECAKAVAAIYQISDEKIQIEAEACELHCRSVDLDLIFRNIIDNAIKYAGDPPVVRITARMSDGDRVIIRFYDNGRGIPIDQRRRIFRRFVRLGLELERERPGTGLGLYIVRTLVRRLRGRISVQDPEDGQGTVFELELPAQPLRKAPAPTTKISPQADVA